MGEFLKDQEDRTYIGVVCGSFKIIDYAGKNQYGSKFWIGKCRCGRLRNFRTSMISGGGKRKATQCNICTKRNGVLVNRTQDEIPHRFWKRLCDHAKRRKIEVLLTKEQAYEIFLKQDKKCIFSDEELHFTLFRTNYNRYTNASLDRIDSSLPYSSENVQWVHKEINMMKGSLSDFDFLNWCGKINEHRK